MFYANVAKQLIISLKCLQADTPHPPTPPIPPTPQSVDSLQVPDQLFSPVKPMTQSHSPASTQGKEL